MVESRNVHTFMHTLRKTLHSPFFVDSCVNRITPGNLRGHPTSLNQNRVEFCKIKPFLCWNIVIRNLLLISCLPGDQDKSVSLLFRRCVFLSSCRLGLGFPFPLLISLELIKCVCFKRTRDCLNNFR